MRLACMSVLMAAVASTASAAPISYIGGTYTQDFNGLPTTPFTAAVIIGRGPHEFSVAGVGATGMGGWTFGNPDRGVGNPQTGSSGNTEFKAHNGSLGSSAGRGVLSHGTNASTDRALGAQSTSNQINRFGVVFQNDTTATIQEVSLSFTGEQWRRGSVESPNSLDYEYLVSAAANMDSSGFLPLGSFVAPNTDAFPETEVALNGNLPINQDDLSHTLTGLNWAPGSLLLFRWNAEDLSGQDDGLAIDNLSMTAVTVPEPASAFLAVMGAFCAFLFRRRRNG